MTDNDFLRKEIDRLTGEWMKEKNKLNIAMQAMLKFEHEFLNKYHPGEKVIREALDKLLRTEQTQNE